MHACAELGIEIRALRVETLDGRRWSIEVATVRGFRLFELESAAGSEANEHHPIETDDWHLDEIVEYLDAVGRPKAPPAGSHPSTTS
jgi:hypothetical protein